MDPIGNKPSGFNGLSMVHSMSVKVFTSNYFYC